MKSARSQRPRVPAFSMMKNGVLITPQLTDSVLESITRDTVIRLAKKMGIKVLERSVDRDRALFLR